MSVVDIVQQPRKKNRRDYGWRDRGASKQKFQFALYSLSEATKKERNDTHNALTTNIYQVRERLLARVVRRISCCYRNSVSVCLSVTLVIHALVV